MNILEHNPTKEPAKHKTNNYFLKIKMYGFFLQIYLSEMHYLHIKVAFINLLQKSPKLFGLTVIKTNFQSLL